MATITATKSGNWTDATVWDLGRIPAVGDTVKLAGFSVVFNADLPAVASVLDSDTVYGEAGTYHEAETSEVQLSVAFGPSSSLIGTYPLPIEPPGTVITIQEHIDAILSSYVFGGEFHYIQRPGSTGSAASVATLFGTWFIVGGSEFSTLEGDVNINEIRIQIDVYATDSADMVTAKNNVIAAMRAANALTDTQDQDTVALALYNRPAMVAQDGYDAETGRYYSQLDYYAWIN